MGFDTMRSFRHLGLCLSPQSPDPEERPAYLLRKDSFMSHEAKRQPTSLPLGAPPFLETKARWSPPSSPVAISPACSPMTTLESSCAQLWGRAAPPTAKEKNALANRLYSAACSGDLTSVEFLLSQGAPINSSVLVSGLFEAFKPAKAGHLSPLAGAASHSQFEAVELLLAYGAEINPPSARCASSPLHQAIRNNDFELARLLLEQGADVDMDNAYKTTPLMYAAKYGSTELVELLLAYKPDLHKLSFINNAAIHWSVWPGNADITELLLKAGADPNHAMPDGNTALACAVLTGSTSMVSCLLKYGADPLLRNEDGETAFHLAASQPNSGELTYLLTAAVASRK